MSRPFLEVIPREIRDQIYTYVLASSSGLVTLMPWTVKVARSLALLRTSRQIHRECKDIIWAHNKLAVREPTSFSTTFNLLPHRPFARRISEVKINLEILDRDELQWVYNSMKDARWDKIYDLSLITLKTSWENPSDLVEFEQLLMLQKYGQIVDGRFYGEEQEGDCFSVSTGWPKFANWGKQNWLKSMLLDSTGIEELLKEIHALFGGRLYVDRVLFLESGQQMLQTLKMDPRNAEIEIIFA